MGKSTKQTMAKAKKPKAAARYAIRGECRICMQDFESDHATENIMEDMRPCTVCTGCTPLLKQPRRRAAPEAPQEPRRMRELVCVSCVVRFAATMDGPANYRCLHVCRRVMANAWRKIGASLAAGSYEHIIDTHAIEALRRRLEGIPSEATDFCVVDEPETSGDVQRRVDPPGAIGAEHKAAVAAYRKEVAEQAEAEFEEYCQASEVDVVLQKENLMRLEANEEEIARDAALALRLHEEERAKRQVKRVTKTPHRPKASPKSKKKGGSSVKRKTGQVPGQLRIDALFKAPAKPPRVTEAVTKLSSTLAGSPKDKIQRAHIRDPEPLDLSFARRLQAQFENEGVYEMEDMKLARKLQAHQEELRKKVMRR